MNKIQIKKEVIKSLEGFRLNVVLDLDVDYDVYGINDMETAIDLAIEKTQQEILKMIDECESHQWEAHKVIIVEELKKQIKQGDKNE